MKIIKIKIINFRGKNFEFSPKKINLLLEPNGYGKSTIMDAVRYGLTGLMPKDNVKDMAVELTLEGGITIYRSKGKETECRFNGKKVTVSALNNDLAQRFGVPLDTMNAAGSSDVLFAKSPAELLQILIRYIPEKLTLERVLLYFQGITDEIYAECEKAVPGDEEFGIEKLADIYNHFYELRRNEKAKLSALKEMFNAIHATKPTRPLNEVEDDLVKLLKSSEGTEAARLWKDYTDKKKIREEQDNQIKALREKLKENTDTIPTQEQLTVIETKKEQAEKSRLAHTEMLSTVRKNIDLYQRTLNSLDKPVCPISEKLVCTTDKTGIRNEIETLLNENLSAKKKHEDMIRHAEDMIQKCKKQREIWDTLKRKHDEFVRINVQIGAYEKNLVAVPDEPPKPASADEFEASKKKLEAERKNIEDYRRKCEILKEAKGLSHQIEIHDAIVKAFSDKGIIKNQIIQYYLEFFEGACNARAEELGINYRLKFVSHNGVYVLAKTHSGEDSGYHSIASLSNGESIIVSFLLMDMLAQSSGTRLMFIDNVEALDFNNLIALSGLIEKEEFKNSYDHVFIGGVNHEDVVGAFNMENSDDSILSV